MKSPSFQFYPTEYLGSQRVQLLTLEEEGAYWRLICFCWQHGSIPADPEKTARLIGKGGSTTLATTVLTMFTPSPNQEGRMVHERLEKEREKQELWRVKSVEGGRKSAETRRKNAPIISDKPAILGNPTTPPTTLPRVVQPPHQPNGNSLSLSSINNNKKRKPEITSTDQEWLEQLQKSDKYKTVNIGLEIQNAQKWCSEKNRQCSRRFFQVWIKKSLADKPMQPVLALAPQPQKTRAQFVGAAGTRKMKLLPGDDWPKNKDGSDQTPDQVGAAEYETYLKTHA